MKGALAPSNNALLLLPCPPHIAECSWNRARQVAANVCCLKSLSNRRILLSSTCGAMAWLYSQEEGAVVGNKRPLPTCFKENISMAGRL